MRIEEVVGGRIREGREARGLTQEEFGQRVASLLGKPWPRQTVSVAEKGQRSFTAIELLACSVAVGVQVADLFRLPADLDFVQTPNGALTREQIDQAEKAAIPGVDDLRQSLQELVSSAQNLQHVGFAVDREARKLQDNLDRVLNGIQQKQEG